MNPKSSYERILMAPPCRLILNFCWCHLILSVGREDPEGQRLGKWKGGRNTNHFPIQSLSYLKIFINVRFQRLVFWHQEVASDSFCFLFDCSWLLVFILYVFSLFFSGFNLFVKRNSLLVEFRSYLSSSRFWSDH